MAMRAWRPALLLAAAATVLLDSTVAEDKVGGLPSSRAYVKGRQLFVNGQPFRINGICYSPTPINESVYFAPYGDYFTPEYSFIWLRDLPLIKAMGANIIRTYGWQPTGDHTAFLDAAYNNGLYVMATYYMGEEEETPVSTSKDRQKVIDGFTKEVIKYREHPSLLFWSFGNELNGVWNKFLQALSTGGGERPNCHWDERYDDLGGCWIHKGQIPEPGSECYETSYCVYKYLFQFLNEAALAAHRHADVLVVSAFADVDGLNDKIDRAGHIAAELDAWTAQVYRGDTFGTFFGQMGNATDKPVLLTEYGVDAYHDKCGEGFGDPKATPCYNVYGDSSGSFIDENSQARFATNLTYEILAQSSEHEHCASAVKGHTNCTNIGGFLMSWTDEYWKGAKAQAACTPTISSSHFSPKKCQEKAHVTCGNWNAAEHDLCGYWLEAAPDHYVNEEWFGITAPSQCADSIDAIEPRQVYWTMRHIWGGGGIEDARKLEKPHGHADVFDDCHEMLVGRCVALGDGGSPPWLLGRLLGAQTRNASKPLPCSGRGTCTTDWHLCGAGGANATATPCCSCHFGYAGAGCTELDVRVYMALGGAATLGVLLAAMVLISLATSIMARYRTKPELHERLLS